MGKYYKAVIGFLFDGSGNVLLIKKNHPAWQNGRLNGIGGKIEKGETPLQAMVREFKEEAGAAVTSWRQFCVMTGDSYRLYLFTSKEKTHINPGTDEGEIAWYPCDKLPDNLLPNMRFLIPMANYKFDITATVVHKSPVC
jgi:8-oxo-dGTP diphosphatase